LPVNVQLKLTRSIFQDFDIAGKYDPMLADSEILTIVVSALRELEIGSFTVKINHRKLLDGMFEVCGVPAEKFRTISSAVDKLDKTPWSEVRREMTEEKGLSAEAADRIGVFVQKSGGVELVEALLKDPELSANASAKEGIEEMGLLLKYLSIFGVADQVGRSESLLACSKDSHSRSSRSHSICRWHEDWTTTPA
jgi:histidyl-tRNA synthetase